MNRIKRSKDKARTLRPKMFQGHKIDDKMSQKNTIRCKIYHVYSWRKFSEILEKNSWKKERIKKKKREGKNKEKEKRMKEKDSRKRKKNGRSWFKFNGKESFNRMNSWMFVECIIYIYTSYFSLFFLFFLSFSLSLFLLFIYRENGTHTL